MIEEYLEPLVADRFRNEEKYRAGHIRVVNPLPGRRVAGVHMPEMRRLAGMLAGREDALRTIAGFKAAAEDETCGRKPLRSALCHEELLVWGMMVNALKSADRVALTKDFVPFIDNWAVCDAFAAGARWFRQTEGAWELICRWFSSENEFEVRFATVMSLSHFMDREYLPRILYRFDILDFSKIRSEYVSPGQARMEGGPEAVRAAGKGIASGEAPYYVRMGVAWCLATALAEFPDDTRAYLRHTCLPEDVIRLYVRKARESFRTRGISPF